MGYLSQVKVKDKRYIYLTEYIGTTEYTSRRERNIYSFGTIEKALFKMRMWQKMPEIFPGELKKMGYGTNDLTDWIKTLETGRSKTGRSYKFKVN